MSLLNRAASGYRAWIEVDACPRPDGTYLVRPLGRRLVYQVDQATKDRFVRITNRIVLGSPVLIAITLLSVAAWPPLSLLILTVGLVVIIAALFWRLRIGRTGTRVPPERWSGLDGLTIMPRWARWIVVFAGVGACVADIMLLPYRRSHWMSTAGLVCILAAVFVQRRKFFNR